MRSDVDMLEDASDNARYALGEYFELYHFTGPILMEIYSHPELIGLTNRFTKNKWGMQPSCEVKPKILPEWERNPIFIEIVNVKTRFPDDKIELFYYIKNTPFTNTKACRILYDKICQYLYREIEFRNNLKKKDPNYVYNFDKVCVFLVNMFETCLNAVRAYQNIFYEPAERVFYSSYFDMNDSLIYWCTRYLPDQDQMYINIANELYRLYTIFKFDLGYLIRKSNGIDLYLTTFLKHNSDHQQWIDNIAFQTVTRLVESNKNELPEELPTVNMESASIEKDLDLAFLMKEFGNQENIIEYSSSDIIVFGDKGVSDDLLGENNIQKLKEELLKLSPDEIRRYTKKDENVKINFTIPEQFKSYLQIEMQCKMTVINLRRGLEYQQSTILEYEGDKFLLFISEDEPGKLRGISLVQDPSTEERKMFTIDKDDEITYTFLFDELND